MNKTQLINAVAKQTGLPKAEVSAGVTSMLDIISGELAEGNSVTLTGFGAFDVGTRKARRGVNPYTRENIEIPELKLPRFRAGKALRQMVK